MLAKKYKLPIQEFVGKKSRLVKTRLFLVKIYPAELPYSRFGVTVSAKVSKNSSGRNRIRRLIYDLAREYHEKMPAGDYWITVLPQAAESSREDLKYEFSKIK